MNKNKIKLVILSIYDGGYYASLLEDDKITTLDSLALREFFFNRFGRYPEGITLEGLRKHYPKNTKIVICDNGDIQI